MGHWRRAARPLVAQIIKETKGQDEKVVRKALREGYPWGEKAMYPYKIWRDEVRRQLGLKVVRRSPISSDAPDQLRLFGEES